jgi:hypothetical protein
MKSGPLLKYSLTESFEEKRFRIGTVAICIPSITISVIMVRGTIPPMSEASFRREYSLMWTISGAACLVIGLVIGPRVAHARGSWLTALVGCLVYLFSLLLCRVVLESIWRRALDTPAVLYFSIPTGGLCLAAVFFMTWLAPNLNLGRRTIFVFSLSMGLLYAASLIWAIGVGIHRKRMGRFDTEPPR